MNWSSLLCEKRMRQLTKSTTSSDLRTEFEKDYHRIIGSSSFRRLQDKTQVFPLERSDFIRTRLTHSLEVSSFAKSLGQNVGNSIIKNQLDSSFGAKQKEDICNILQCAGLIHDLGNPPFGHFGETIIQDYFKSHLSTLCFKGKTLDTLLNKQMVQDLCHFDGNTQAFRIVTKLHCLVDENGMNLTKALLGTIMKYPVSSIETDKKNGNIKYKKFGYFYAEQDIYNDLILSLQTGGNRHPLTFLLEAADDIAYKTADIEDAFKKGCITYSQFHRELSNALSSLSENSKEYEIFSQAIQILNHKYNKALQNQYHNPEKYAILNWTVSVQGTMILTASDSFIRHYRKIMDGSYTSDLFFGTPVEKLMEVLGDIAYRYAFTSTPIFKLEISASIILKFLLDEFIHAVLYYDTDKKLSPIDEKLIKLISEDYKFIYHYYSDGKSENEKLYLRLLLVTDFISGMTDSYAKNLYQELNGIS